MVGLECILSSVVVGSVVLVVYLVEKYMGGFLNQQWVPNTRSKEADAHREEPIKPIEVYSVVTELVDEIKEPIGTVIEEYVAAGGVYRDATFETKEQTLTIDWNSLTGFTVSGGLDKFFQAGIQKEIEKKSEEIFRRTRGVEKEIIIQGGETGKTFYFRRTKIWTIWQVTLDTSAGKFSLPVHFCDEIRIVFVDPSTLHDI